jgi:hypothetical protein
MAKLNFLKNKASNTWPSVGTMHVDLPQGLEDVTHRKVSQEVPEDSGDEERLPVITFFLGILAALYHRCNTRASM